MKLRYLFLTAILLTTASCQSTPKTELVWQKTGPGPTLAVATAQCEIASASTQQGMYAQGQAGFVIGAQLGNAIANAGRKATFIKQCLTINGWQEVAVPVAPKPV